MMTRPAELTKLFPRRTDAPPGRTMLQLTSGEDFCYPLYYFAPSITADGRYMVYHRETPGEVHEIQLHRLDLTTGASVRLTEGAAANADWQPWGVDPARGILGDRSALAVQRGEVIYFDGRRARAVDLHTLAHRDLFDVPEDRFTLAQNCVTGDDQWFVYVHVDRDAYQRLLATRLERGEAFRENAHICEGTAIAAYNLDTGEHRIVLTIDYPVHHVHAYGEHHIAFSHIPGDIHGMGFMSIHDEDYTVPRPADGKGGKIIHHVPTDRGIAYEVNFRPEGGWAGFCDPHTGRRVEFAVRPGTNHTGVDPAGNLLFYQVGRDRVQVMQRFSEEGRHDWLDLFGAWPTYGRGQKTHFHPRLVLGRRWMLLTAGDPRSRTNHLFLVDVGDLRATEALPCPSG